METLGTPSGADEYLAVTVLGTHGTEGDNCWRQATQSLHEEAVHTYNSNTLLLTL